MAISKGPSPTPGERAGLGQLAVGDAPERIGLGRDNPVAHDQILGCNLEAFRSASQEDQPCFGRDLA